MIKEIIPLSSTIASGSNMVPSQRLPEVGAGSGDGGYTFVLVHGALHAAEHWDPLVSELQSRGHHTLAPNLPADRPDATLEDDTNAVLAAIENHDNLVLVAHSRGVETVPGVLARITLDRMQCVVMLNSGGPHGLNLQPNEQFGTTDPPRYTPEFLGGVLNGDASLYEFDPARAIDVFYHEVDPTLAEIAVHNLRPQRQPDKTPIEALVLPDEIPVYALLSSEDKAINLDRAREVYRQWLDIEPIGIPGDHTPQLSRPVMLAEILIRLAQTAHVK